MGSNPCLPANSFASFGLTFSPTTAQETALLSAIEVPNGMNGGSTPRGDALLSAV